jgi:hypothetical protein
MQELFTGFAAQETLVANALHQHEREWVVSE